VIKIQKDYEFVQFINIGNDQTAVMINNPETNQIRYILISLDENYKKDDDKETGKADDKETGKADDKETGKADDKATEAIEGIVPDDAKTAKGSNQDGDESSQQKETD